MSEVKKVPYPLRWPVLKNTKQMIGKPVFDTMNKLAEEFNGLYELEFPTERFYVVSKHEYVKELLDTSRFQKTVDSGLLEIRRLAGDGLFTAFNDEPNWKIAQKILTPAFSMKNMKAYLSVMNEVMEEFCTKWEKNQAKAISVTDDMTRYTLETIGRCAFNYSFQSFDRDELDPFIGAMNRALAYALKQGQMLDLQKKLAFLSNRRFENDCQFMNELVDRLVAERKSESNPGQYADLLARMLEGDEKRGLEALSSENIRYQLITFLIAGHETTSGLLSFAVYLLMQHPEVFERARQEVDEVVGNRSFADLTMGDLARLKYSGQILKESLRLYPTAPGFIVSSPKEETLGGQYRLRAGQSSLILLYDLHRDKEVWGESAEEFDPDRFAPEKMSSIPSTAFRAFGNGPRSCIGQNFAMVEATLLLSCLVQRFDFVDAYNYKLKIAETLTIKPADFEVQVRARRGGSTESAA